MENWTLRPIALGGPGLCEDTVEQTLRHLAEGSVKTLPRITTLNRLVGGAGGGGVGVGGLGVVGGGVGVGVGTLGVASLFGICRSPRGANSRHLFGGVGQEAGRGLGGVGAGSLGAVSFVPICRSQ